MAKGVIVKGRARGGGRQLASYLLTQGENEQVRVLSVDNQERFSEQDFRDLLGDFSLTEKLTRSRKGTYHLTINPPEDIARQLTDKQWLEAAAITMEELGFTGQRMASVLHQKHGRRHLHLAIERTNLETGKATPISHNYARHLKAGKRLAQLYGLEPLPERNPRRGTMKTTLTKLWQQTTDAASFIRQAKEQGYMIAKGHERPFLVVDDTGQSFNLVRHLEGVKTQTVRNRMKGSVLLSEREAVAFVRQQLTITENKKIPNQENTRQAFLDSLNKTRERTQTHKPRMR
jgi:hypothetical protein